MKLLKHIVELTSEDLSNIQYSMESSLRRDVLEDFKSGLISIDTILDGLTSEIETLDAINSINGNDIHRGSFMIPQENTNHYVYADVNSNKTYYGFKEYLKRYYQLLKKHYYEK